MLIIYLFLSFTAGIFIGLLLRSIGPCDGILNIEENPEKDLFSFELNNLDSVYKKNHLYLKIRRNK